MVFGIGESSQLICVSRTIETRKGIYVFRYQTQGEEEIQSWKQGDELKGNSWSRNFEQSLRDQIHIDRGYLTRIALKAVADSGLNAFYIDFECVDSAIIEQKERGMDGEVKQVCVVPSKNFIKYLTFCHLATAST